MLRAVFMGTPDFAVPGLNALSEIADIAAVVTQPDRPKGRGGKLSFPEVKEAAIKLGLPVLQPEKIRKNIEFLEELERLQPDIIVVAAYGQLLPESILKLPKYGCINVHGSLLPKYRGASPIQSAVLNGDTETGVTIMRMDKGLDTGDIILIRKLEILPSDNAGTLFDKVAECGALALKEAITQIENGSSIYTKQDDSKASVCRVITKEQAHIDWNKSSGEIVNAIRAYNPWPCAFSVLDGTTVKLWSAVKAESEERCAPGTITAVEPDIGIYVKTADGAVLITELQAGSSKRMLCSDYLRGHNVYVGNRFF